MPPAPSGHDSCTPSFCSLLLSGSLGGSFFEDAVEVFIGPVAEDRRAVHHEGRCRGDAVSVAAVDLLRQDAVDRGFVAHALLVRRLVETCKRRVLADRRERVVAARPLFLILEQDRKSTRLNSSP